MLTDHILTRTDILRISKKDPPRGIKLGAPCTCDWAIQYEGLVFASRHARGTRLVMSRSVPGSLTRSPEEGITSMEEHRPVGAHMNPTSNNRHNSQIQLSVEFNSANDDAILAGVIYLLACTEWESRRSAVQLRIQTQHLEVAILGHVSPLLGRGALP
jgi:hypothetical protein